MILALVKLPDSRLRSEALPKFEGYRCTDNCFTFVLVATGNIIGNSQTAKQMKDFHLKYEIALEKLEIFSAKCNLQFCWLIHTSLIHGSIHVRITDMFGLLFDTHLNTLRLYIVFNINKKKIENHLVKKAKKLSRYRR